MSLALLSLLETSQMNYIQYCKNNTLPALFSATLFSYAINYDHAELILPSQTYEAADMKQSCTRSSHKRTSLPLVLLSLLKTSHMNYIKFRKSNTIPALFSSALNYDLDELVLPSQT